MTTLNTLEDFYEYKKQVQLQKKALDNSSGISELEKMNLHTCYDYQIDICDAKLTGVPLKKHIPFYRIKLRGLSIP